MEDCNLRSLEMTLFEASSDHTWHLTGATYNKPHKLTKSVSTINSVSGKLKVRIASPLY